MRSQLECGFDEPEPLLSPDEINPIEKLAESLKERMKGMKRFLILFALLLMAPLPIVAQAKDASLDAAAKQKQVEEDRQRLYQLAAELKAEVEKSGKNKLSITAIKKAEEIEKLARQRLYQLSTELKAEVEKSDRNTVSITAVKKAEEIEKLAKILKETVK